MDKLVILLFMSMGQTNHLKEYFEIKLQDNFKRKFNSFSNCCCSGAQFSMLDQGTLTEGESSVLLTSLY